MHARRTAVEKIWAVRFSILVLVVFQALDALTTSAALHVGAEEGNPVMADAIGDGGPASLVLAKVAVMATWFIGVALLPRRAIFARTGLFAMNVVYGLVIVQNALAFGLLAGDWALPVAMWVVVGVTAAGTIGLAWEAGGLDPLLRS